MKSISLIDILTSAIFQKKLFLLTNDFNYCVIHVCKYRCIDFTESKTI